MRKYSIQLMNALTGAAIDQAGGAVYVARQGAARKATLYTSTGGAQANPVALDNGFIEFYTDDDTAAVDLYIQAPTGHFVVQKNVPASGPFKLNVNAGLVQTVMVLPFSISDTTANTETDTGFDIVDDGAILPYGIGVEVLTADSGMTIDVGTDSGDSGDADGFIDGLSLASATFVKATLLNSGVTLGTKLFVQDSVNAGDKAPEADTSQAGKSITYTLSASTDTGEGFIILPAQLPYASL